jgi:hypothetical protein
MNIQTYACRFSAICLLAFAGGCSTSGPTYTDLTSSENGDEYWRKRYEQQCIASGAQPGTPMLVKCVDDLMEIRAEQQED